MVKKAKKKNQDFFQTYGINSVSNVIEAKKVNIIRIDLMVGGVAEKKSLIINDGFDGSGSNCLYDNKNFFNSNYSQKIKFKNISLNYNNKKIVKIILNRFKLNSKDKFYYNDQYQFFLYNYRNLKKKIKIFFN